MHRSSSSLSSEITMVWLKKNFFSEDKGMQLSISVTIFSHTKLRGILYTFHIQVFFYFLFRLLYYHYGSCAPSLGEDTFT